MITPSNDPSHASKFNFRRELEHSDWKNDPNITFDQRASLTIAQWILILFGGVYLLGFFASFVLFWSKDVTFEKGAELVKFLVQLPLPLVTLAVGYYLGDRNRQATTTRKR